MNNHRHRNIDCGETTSAGGCCQRREFFKLVGLGAAAGMVDATLFAGPFEENEYLATIPIDKKLNPDWVASLYNRGEKEIYTSRESLRNIGMPVGGLFAGTVYLGGDGRLWLWDIFNRDQEGILPRRLAGDVPVRQMDDPLVARPDSMLRAGLNYLEPAAPTSPFSQEFALRIGERIRPLNEEGFAEIKFDGRYPIGQVSYRDADCPIQVELEAFSPFIPLDADNSSLPATVMRYRLKNHSDEPVNVEIFGTLENPVCQQSSSSNDYVLKNFVVQNDSLTALVCSASARDSEVGDPRPDILFDNFENPDYVGWTVDGTAFGQGPVDRKNIPAYQGEVGGVGRRVVNSHASAPGDDVSAKDAHRGTLTSRAFEIRRKFMQFYIGGGNHQGRTCVNLLVDGNVIASAAGHNNNRMRLASLEVGKFEGRQAQLQIVDDAKGGWGNIGVDHIRFTDRPIPAGDMAKRPDYGTIALAVFEPVDRVRATASTSAADSPADATAPSDERLIGRVGGNCALAPSAEAMVTFVLGWHFPNLTIRDMPEQMVGNHYASRFDSALEAVRYLAEHLERLYCQTRLWVDTWYDSTLPYWLLDRSMANTSTLATTTCYRFRDGRFWAWEGVGCCAGTCTHVWHYAQAVGRLFPEIERDQRERVDFGLALQPDGGIAHRAYLDRVAGPADDGHCGRILGAYREHQMSIDDGFLRRNWSGIKQAVEWMIARDGDRDGMLEGAQHNTLDAAWYGKVAWLASMYLVALKAGEAMAREMGDETFARRCRDIAKHGAETILQTYNGEFFIQIEDPRHTDAIAAGGGCHIDQLLGQTWAHWVGLGRLFDREKQLTALRALWKYNFVPDIGAFRRKFRRGRWYATAGDAGLVMCTWPRDGRPPQAASHWQYGYFNECMSGFEWQAAAQMIFEGQDQPDLLKQGLAISRAIHDRYNAALRNPYNEIECGDHYARAMASYGVYQAVCGYEHHGPRGHLGFAPRLSPDNFKAAFTAAGAWGSFTQRRLDGTQHAMVDVKWGQLRLKTLSLTLARDKRAKGVEMTAQGRDVEATFENDGIRVNVNLKNDLTLLTSQTVQIKIATEDAAL